jgi:hypothetical protein
MPLRPFLGRDAVFGPDDLEAMTAAFEQALGKLGLRDRTDAATAIVARKVIELATHGERDPAKLCAAVLNSLEGDEAASA